MKKLGALAILVSLLIASPSVAQQNQNIDPAQMKQAIELMFNSVLEVLSDPKMGVSMAKFYRSFYDGLIQQGFSKEEAMKIITATPLPIGQK